MFVNAWADTSRITIRPRANGSVRVGVPMHNADLVWLQFIWDEEDVGKYEVEMPDLLWLTVQPGEVAEALDWLKGAIARANAKREAIERRAEQVEAEVKAWIEAGGFLLARSPCRAKLSGP